MLESRGHNAANTGKNKRPTLMDDYVFAGLVTIAVTLLAMGVMDILAVMITTLAIYFDGC